VRVWQVTEHDNQLRFYWFATKGEAEQHRRDWEPPFDGATCEVDGIDVGTGRKGIVDAMNHVITLTCFNEG